MITKRDLDQMLKCALTIKEESQRFIDFAKMHGSGKGGEGEEDMEEGVEVDESDSPEDEYDDTEEESKMSSDEEDDDEEEKKKKKGKLNAIAILLKKRLGK